MPTGRRGGFGGSRSRIGHRSTTFGSSRTTTTSRTTGIHHRGHRSSGGGGSGGGNVTFNMNVDENAPGRFNVGIFECCKYPGNCVDSCICYYCMMGKIENALNEGADYDENGTCCTTACYLACIFDWLVYGTGFIYGMMLRQGVAARYGIGGESCCDSCLYAGCCCCLSVNQLANEMTSRGEFPGGIAFAYRPDDAPPRPPRPTEMGETNNNNNGGSPLGAAGNTQQMNSADVNFNFAIAGGIDPHDHDLIFRHLNNNNNNNNGPNDATNTLPMQPNPAFPMIIATDANPSQVSDGFTHAHLPPPGYYPDYASGVPPPDINYMAAAPFWQISNNDGQPPPPPPPPPSGFK